MKIDVKDLQEGDEIIISSYSDLKYLKVLRAPQIRKNKVHWKTKQPLYKSVKCSVRQEVFTGSRGHSWKQFVCTPDDHNGAIYKDLNERTIWLVKRKKQ